MVKMKENIKFGKNIKYLELSYTAGRSVNV